MTIDLHLHTTASDGLSSPAELVDLAAARGLRVMAVTDHDTTAAVAEVRTRAAARSIEAVAGIEITAVEGGRDIHVLGYFFNPDDPALAAFLAAARADRVGRVEAIAGTLAALGMPIDVAAILSDAGRESGRSVGRPSIAAAMIAAGYVRNKAEAFDKWLGQDGPVFVARSGATPEEVIATLHAAGGIVSLAHPGRTRIDARIPELRDAGLDALEVFHSDHDTEMVERYAGLARRLGLLVTGGSDFHGDSTHGLTPGATGMPEAEWTRLSAERARHAGR
jgi:predicted metal-dependent phosphoesterase TrpH